MAGSRRFDVQKCRTLPRWIFAVVLLQVCRVNAHADGDRVVVVADGNWTRILEGEWLIQLYVCHLCVLNDCDVYIAFGQRVI